MKNTIIRNYMLNILYIHPGELPTPHVPPFTASLTVSVPLPNDASRLDYILYFLNTQLIIYIVECMNVDQAQSDASELEVAVLVLETSHF